MAFDQSIADQICERIAQGEPLRQICRDPAMKSKSEVYRWLDEKSADYNADFAGRFARARVLGFDEIAEEALEIADDDTRDWEPIRDQDGQITGVRVDGEHVTRAKLRIETRLKLLAKWDPKRYGEKIAVGGADDLPPIKSDRPLAQMSLEEIRAGLAALTKE